MKIRVIASLIILLLLTVLAASWYTAYTLAAPANHRLPQPPDNITVKPVEFEGVFGWFVEAHNPDLSDPGLPDPKHCVVLMHSIRSDRTSMLNRARFLKTAGYSSLLFDFQAHGESPGDHISFGYRESANAHAAIRYLRQRMECNKIAAIGQSLGGAAALLGPQPINVDALILESVFPSIVEATRNRLAMRLGFLGDWATPLLTLQIPLLLGITLDDLRPIEGIKKIQMPVMVMTGSHDQHTTASEAKRLYDAAPTKKIYWEIPGAAHEDLYRYLGDEYENRILQFLSQSFEL